MKKISSLALLFIILTTIFSTAAIAGIDDAFVILGNGYEIDDSIFVEIISPREGSVVYHGYSLMVEAYVESENLIETVEFYKDNEPVPFATVNSAPYTAQIICQLGSFSVYVKAYTDDGYNLSEEHNITVDVNAGSAEKVYIDADFDSSTAAPAHFELLKFNETSEICTTPTDNNNVTRPGNSAHISIDGTANGAPAMDYYNPDMPFSGKVVIETSVMSETTNWPAIKNQWFQLFDKDGSVGDLLEFFGDTISSFHSGSGGRNTVLASGLQANVWYDFKFIIDFDTLTYTVFLNGVQKGGTLGLQGSTTPTTAEKYKNIVRLRTRIAPINCGMYMDYLKIYSLPRDRVKVYTAENFNLSTATPSGFNLDTNATAEIAASPEDYLQNTRTGNSVHLLSSVGNVHPYFNYRNEVDPLKGLVTIEADIMPQASTYPNAIELFYLVSTAGNLGRLAKIENNNITLWNGSARGITLVSGFTQKRWYKIKYVINVTEKKFSVWVDGVSKATDVTIVPENSRAMNEIITVQYRVAGVADALTNGIYVDDVNISSLKPSDIIGAVFTKDNGVLSVDKKKAPYDLRKITVDFTDEMNAASFSGVTLKDSSDNIAAISGLYNAATKQYIVSVSEELKYNEEYKLTFPATVTCALGVQLGTPKVITFETDIPEVAINSLTFQGAGGAMLDKSNTGGTIKVIVDATSYAEDGNRSFSLILAKYDAGKFDVCGLNSQPTLAPTENNTFEVSLTGIPNDVSSSDIILYIWDGFNNLRPIYKITEVE